MVISNICIISAVEIKNNITVNNIMEKKSFYVLNWDFNSDKLVHYDILPYFRECYKKLSKAKRPVSINEWKEFIKSNGRYRYWARCEYEIIITGWPQQNRKVKVDVWRQIEMNINIIVDILMEEFNSNKKD